MIKGWWVYLLGILSCLPILLHRSVSTQLLKDSDTNFLIAKLNEANSPWKWFAGDWPLENHFYRPISTLAFEMDNRLHPGNSVAFGLTNALICCVAALALFWFIAEIRKSVIQGAVAAWLFAFWILGGWMFGFTLAGILLFMTSAIFMLIALPWPRRGYRWQVPIAALGASFLFDQLVATPRDLYAHTVAWLPGRTATVMTVFTLVALAAYTRFEKAGAERSSEPEPNSLELPATRTSSQNSIGNGGWGWYAVSMIATALALGSYEQAVMIPFVVFGIGVWLRTDRYETRFRFQLGFWALLVAYMILRVQLIPVAPSGYQKQQFRNGPGLYLDILGYILPSLWGLRSSVMGLGAGALILITDSFWTPITFFLTNISAWVCTGSRWKKPAIALGMTLLAYLPMAFLKQFGHYHFWPAAMKTLFILSLIEAAMPYLVSAVSPRAIQAPKRLDRAVGSLPRL